MTHPPASPGLVELVDPRDPRLLPWLDLYETAFPPAERVLVSTLLAILERRLAGDATAERLLSLLDERGAPVGLALYSNGPEEPAAFLWYLAVAPERRGRGLGAWAYGEIVRRVSDAGSSALFIEAEIPTGPDDALAWRRLGFYRRRGARLLGSVHYLQDVGPHQAPLPMHLLVHPLAPLAPDAAYTLARALFGDRLTQTGPLRLD